jgi:hypothetical protein
VLSPEEIIANLCKFLILFRFSTDHKTTLWVR